MKYGLAAALLLGLLLGATAVEAAPSDLLKCDGYGGRRSGGETAARAVAIIATLGILGSPEADNPGAKLSGSEGAAACGAALIDDRVKNNPVRRGEVLLGMSIHQLEAGLPKAAFETAVLARAVETDPAQKAAFDRTIGVSALVVQAYARLADNDEAAAEALAAQAVAARPYAQSINDHALFIMGLTPAISPAEAAALDRRTRLRSAGAFLRSERRIAAGDWQGASADLRRSVALDTVASPDLVAEAMLATALAANGATAEAEAMLATLKEHSDLAAGGATDAVAVKVQRADEIARLARIQLALNLGQFADAKLLIAAQTRWLVSPPLVAGVLANARAKGIATVDDPAKLLENAIAAQRKILTSSSFAERLMGRLPRWEDDWPVLARNLLNKANAKVEVNRERLGTEVIFTPRGDAFADSLTEAALLTIGRMAAEAGTDRFAVVRDARIYGGEGGSGKTAVARQGEVANVQLIGWIKSGDPAWAGQADRALTIADLERDLGGFYPRPVPVAAGK